MPIFISPYNYDYILSEVFFLYNIANCLIENLYEIDPLPHLKIYTKESGTVTVKTTGGRDEANGW